jgi:hypothetical protein
MIRLPRLAEADPRLVAAVEVAAPSREQAEPVGQSRQAVDRLRRVAAVDRLDALHALLGKFAHDGFELAEVSPA